MSFGPPSYTSQIKKLAKQQQQLGEIQRGNSNILKKKVKKSVSKKKKKSTLQSKKNMDVFTKLDQSSLDIPLDLNQTGLVQGNDELQYSFNGRQGSVEQYPIDSDNFIVNLNGIQGGFLNSYRDNSPQTQPLEQPQFKVEEFSRNDSKKSIPMFQTLDAYQQKQKKESQLAISYEKSWPSQPRKKQYSQRNGSSLTYRDTKKPDHVKSSSKIKSRKQTDSTYEQNLTIYNESLVNQSILSARRSQYSGANTHRPSYQNQFKKSPVPRVKSRLVTSAISKSTLSPWEQALSKYQKTKSQNLNKSNNSIKTLEPTYFDKILQSQFSKMDIKKKEYSITIIRPKTASHEMSPLTMICSNIQLLKELKVMKQNTPQYYFVGSKRTIGNQILQSKLRSVSPNAPQAKLILIEIIKIKVQPTPKFTNNARFVESDRNTKIQSEMGTNTMISGPLDRYINSSNASFDLQLKANQSSMSIDKAIAAIDSLQFEKSPKHSQRFKDINIEIQTDSEKGLQNNAILQMTPQENSKYQGSVNNWNDLCLKVEQYPDKLIQSTIHQSNRSIQEFPSVQKDTSIRSISNRSYKSKKSQHTLDIKSSKCQVIDDFYSEVSSYRNLQFSARHSKAISRKSRSIRSKSPQSILNQDLEVVQTKEEQKDLSFPKLPWDTLLDKQDDRCSTDNDKQQQIEQPQTKISEISLDKSVNSEQNEQSKPDTTDKDFEAFMNNNIKAKLQDGHSDKDLNQETQAEQIIDQKYLQETINDNKSEKEQEIIEQVVQSQEKPQIEEEKVSQCQEQKNVKFGYKDEDDNNQKQEEEGDIKIEQDETKVEKSDKSSSDSDDSSNTSEDENGKDFTSKSYKGGYDRQHMSQMISQTESKRFTNILQEQKMNVIDEGEHEDTSEDSSDSDNSEDRRKIELQKQKYQKRATMTIKGDDQLKLFGLLQQKLKSIQK